MKQNKELYNSPQIEVIEIEVEGMIATSLVIKEDVTISGSGRSKQRLWDSDN